MPPRFYSSDSLATHLPASEHLVTEAIAAHLRVLRLRVADALTLFDGGGDEWEAEIIEIDKRHTRVRLGQRHRISREPSFAITLVQALATADKMDLIVQKATELGVLQIVPVRSARSGLQLDAERAEKKRRHWQAIAIAACEQCGRNRIPQIAAVTSLSDWLRGSYEGTRFALHPSGPMPLTRALTASIADGALRSLALVVGPEGGFDEAELALATANATVVTLGPRVLRTETSGMAAIAAVHATLGDFA